MLVILLISHAAINTMGDGTIRIFKHEMVSGCIFCIGYIFWSEIIQMGMLLTLQGCISISLSLHQTSFCFVCSHLASGEKEGDELKRNADVAEILKSIQFPKVCKNPHRKIPERIIDHE